MVALGVIVIFLGGACSNSPYKEGEAESNTYFTAMSTELQTLDPAISYSSDEYEIVQQIYEPPFQYHYLKRPYEVIPLTAEAMPKPIFYDKAGKRCVGADPATENVGTVEYVIRIKPGIKYAPHPCFAKKTDGTPFYQDINPKGLDEFEYPSMMPEKGTRNLSAKDYVLQMYRLADFRLRCPVFASTFEKYVVGMDTLAVVIKAAVEAEREKRKAAAEREDRSYNHEQDEKANPIVIDYLKLPCPGVQLIDDLTYKVTLKAKYPQIIYWLAMPFCAPMPQEALDFFNEPAMVEKQFTAKRCPVGTGPYFLETFKPNEKIVLLRNPVYHEEFYPSEGGPGDQEKDLLKDAGKRVPFIDKQVWMIEKEAFSSWQKFMQGYYDNSGISEENFDKAVQQTDTGTDLSDEMREMEIVMHSSVKTVYYELQFNMQDPVVGSLADDKCKLRQAISIAMDFNEYLDVFQNGRGIMPNSPLPPGIFGSKSGEEGTNSLIHEWDPGRKAYKVRSIEDARKLMAEAGYPNGLGKDGQPLTLTLDHSRGGDSKYKKYIQWYQKKLALIGIKLEDRGTDRKQMDERRKEGNWQISTGGWGADYPDPENFLFLYYGPNGQKKAGGMNRCNYENPKYDELFAKMERMSNSPERQVIIDDLMKVWQKDSPARTVS